MIRTLALVSLASLALAACGNPAEEAEDPEPTATETMMPVEPDGGIGDGAAPIPDGSLNQDLATTLEAMPQRLQGVWFGVDSVCDDYAEMRINIGPSSIQFYESEGIFQQVERLPDGKIRAQSSMTGEGEEWQSTFIWSLENDGKILVREDRGPDAYSDPIRYHRCSA